MSRLSKEFRRVKRGSLVTVEAARLTLSVERHGEGLKQAGDTAFRAGKRCHHLYIRHLASIQRAETGQRQRVLGTWHWQAFRARASDGRHGR